MLILPTEAPARRPLAPEPSAAVSKNVTDILFAGGVVVSFVALTHAVLIWAPPHFGSPPWEFAAATQTIDVFPLAITGSALLSFGTIARGWRRAALALAFLYVLSSVLLIALTLLVALDLGVAWQSVTPEIREQLLKTGGKAAAFSAAFVIFYWWLSIRLIRYFRRRA